MSVFIGSLLMLAVGLPWTARAEVKLGNEVLAARHFNVLQGKRVGVLANPSGVNGHLESTIEVLRAAPGVKLAALFGPEHGIYGDVGAGDKVARGMDARTGLPAYSLYGRTYKPTSELLGPGTRAKRRSGRSARSICYTNGPARGG